MPKIDKIVHDNIVHEFNYIVKVDDRFYDCSNGLTNDPMNALRHQYITSAQKRAELFNTEQFQHNFQKFARKYKPFKVEVVDIRDELKKTQTT